MLANVFGWTRPKKGNQQHSNSYVSKRLRHGSIVGSPLCKIDKPRISLHPLTMPWRLTLPNCFDSSFTKQGAWNSRVDANNRKTLISSALHAFIYLIGCSEFSLWGAIIHHPLMNLPFAQNNGRHPSCDGQSYIEFFLAISRPSMGRPLRWRFENELPIGIGINSKLNWNTEIGTWIQIWKMTNWLTDWLTDKPSEFKSNAS